MAAIYEQNRNPEKRAEPFTEYTFFPDLNPRKQMEDEPHELTPEEEDAEVDAMIAIMKGQR
jgi:hypothetical protein